MEATQRDGLTPLLVAASNGREAMVAALISKGANLDVRDVCGSTPLALASVRGHIGIMRLLLDNGANIDAEDEDDVTPLHRAVMERGNDAAVELLLSRGANPRSSKVVALGSDYTTEQRERFREFVIENSRGLGL
ncbi:hypothetical protein TgHK011_002118 [Trichoderma gracile]|nr:hypothetical protein TgHK011_002118 [Trichoderma gracile]